MLNMDKIMKRLKNAGPDGQNAGRFAALTVRKGWRWHLSANGQGIMSVKIDPEVLGDGDVEMVEDLVLAAVNEALRRSKELAAEKMGKVTGGLGSLGLF